MSTIVVRGATVNLMDDVERAIDDAVNVVKAIIRDPRLVPGAGATEIALAAQIISFGEVNFLSIYTKEASRRWLTKARA